MNYRKLSCCQLRQQPAWRYGSMWLLCLPLLLSLFWPRPAAAHGGVVIDSGFTDHFEWLVSIDPYPIVTGQATLTLLVYDLTTYDPVSDLQVKVAMAPPGTTRPCCKPTELSAPITLVIDPQLYPGDYSERINLDQPGEWALQFVVEGGERSFTTVVSVPVRAAPPGQAVSPVTTPDVAATSTVFAQNVQAARQQNSPLAGPVSPVTTTTSAESTTSATAGPLLLLGIQWWLWGIAALIPLGMGWLLLRKPQTVEEDDDDA